MDPESNDWRPYKETHRDTDTEGRKPRDKEAGVRVMQPQAREGRGLPEAGRHRKDFP